MFWKRVPGRWTSVRKGSSSVRWQVIARCEQKSTCCRAEVTAPLDVRDGPTLLHQILRHTDHWKTFRIASWIPFWLHKQAVKPVVWPPQYAFTPTSGDLDSHPELSAWMSWYANTLIGCKCPCCAAIASPIGHYWTSIWNSLPADIRLCENVPLFKRHLKTHLFRLT